jgi:GNAT superfamily N-acetyltransferase
MRRRNTGTAGKRVQKTKRKVERKRAALTLTADLQQQIDGTLRLGYSKVARGHVACVVTFLEMTTRPASVPEVVLPDGITLDALHRPDLAAYRTLFRKVGADWLWCSRLIISDEELGAILNDDHYEIFVVRNDGEDIGLLELDFRKPAECELAFFGLVSGASGKGLGRALMNMALELAWSHPIRRMLVRTCTFDHPSALGFYVRSGFRPYAVQVEVQPDPRLTGHLPLYAAPHVPIIRPDS